MPEVGPPAAADVLAGFDPLIVEWFTRRFSAPTEPQILGWPEIRAVNDVLISAPTCSVKTLSAFLIRLDGLVPPARAGSLTYETAVVDASPREALSNHTRNNLDTPP